MTDQGTPQDPQHGQPNWQNPDPGQPTYPDPNYPQQPTYPQQQPSYPPPDYGPQPTTPLPEYGQPGYPQQGYPQQGYPQQGYPPYGGPGGPTPPGGPYPPAGPVGSGGGGRKGLFIGGGVLVALLAVIAYFVFSGGSSSASTPKAAVTTLLDAGKTLDVKKAKSVLCEASKNLSTYATPTATDQVTSYKVGAVTQTDANHATVSVTVTTSGQSTSQTESVPVKKEGGSWKVCPTDILSSLPSSLPSSIPSGLLPSGIPSGLLPSGLLPSGIPSGLLPSGLPSGLGGLNICASVGGNPLSVATTYIEAAGTGLSDMAAPCIYHGSVPDSVTASLKGKLYIPSGSNGDTYDFGTADGKSKAAVTVTKESDGKYYVTNVQVQ